MSVNRVLLVVLASSAVLLAVGAGPRIAAKVRALPLRQEPDGPSISIPYIYPLPCADCRRRCAQLVTVLRWGSKWAMTG